MKQAFLTMVMWGGAMGLAQAQGVLTTDQGLDGTLASERVCAMCVPGLDIAVGPAVRVNPLPVGPADTVFARASDPLGLDAGLHDDRSWGVGAAYTVGALTLRGAHRNRHVATIRPWHDTGASFDARNALVAASYQLSWGTAYAAYSASRGWGASPLFNPDNPYGANMASTSSTDSRDTLVGVAVPVGRATTFLASLIRKNDRDLANRDATQMAVGATYAMSRRLDFYATCSHIRSRNGAGGLTGSAAINLGMRHAF